MARKILFLSALLLLASSLKAEYFKIVHYDIRVDVETSGVFSVEEILDVEFFTNRHGIYRTIPTTYRVNGKKTKIKIFDVEVPDWPVKEEGDLQTLLLRIGDPDQTVNGRQRYVIRYKVKNAWLFEPEHTEFYWNLVGNYWETTIDSISYQVRFANYPELGSDDFHIATGYFGEQGTDATVRHNGEGILSGASTRVFQPGEGLTLAVRLPADYVPRPSREEVLLKNYGLLAIPALFIGLILWLWGRIGRDNPVTTVVEYYPPEGVNPSEAGGFFDDKIDNRDLTALLPYWGAQGYLEIRETQEKILGIFKSESFEFIKRNELPGTRPAYERTIFNGLFASGDQIKLDSLKDQFYTTMNEAKKQLKEAILRRAYYTPKSVALKNLLPLGAVISLAGVVLCFMFDQAPAGVGFLISGVLFLVFQRPMLRRTLQGQQVYQQLKGFREFVDKADRPRLERLLQDDPTYFERTLPYAIAFGMASSWAKKFDGLFTDPPSWYHGYPGSSPSSFSSFADNFSSSMNQVQSAFTSSPSSSGGGGGSSGGGFGGGGGGSW